MTVPSTTAREATRPTGWLLILTRLLIVGQPLYLAFVASHSFNAVALRGRPVIVVLVLRLAVAALGVAAGIALTNRRPGGVALARTAILAAAAVQALVYTTPYFPNNLKPGDAPLVLGAWLLFDAAWLVYLWRSRQVRALSRESSG
jgi:hypothetical protein